jgi:hypothetical protein
MSTAWNAWYHVMTNTYGTWLRGDPRGWRERHHRKHVDGDYKNPPKEGIWEETFEQSKELMNRDPVYLEASLRAVALDALVACLAGDGIEVLVAALDDHHLHLVGRFADHRPRERLGWAKRAATKAVKAHVEGNRAFEAFDLQLSPGEGIWQKRSAAKPIRDRAHHVRAVNYVADHELEAALVYLDPRLLEVQEQRRRRSS